MPTDAEMPLFVENHEKLIKKLSSSSALAHWNAMASGKRDDYARGEKLDNSIAMIYNDPKTFQKLKKWDSMKKNNSMLEREIKIIYHRYLGSQGNPALIKKIIKASSEIEMKFNTFRAKINSSEFTKNQLDDILKSETNSEKLRAAWEAGKTTGAVVEDKLLNLVNMRNLLAIENGFKNYYEFSMELEEMDIREMMKIFDKVSAETDSPFRKIKKEIDDFLCKRCNISQKDLRPWHYQNSFFQEAPEICNLGLDILYEKTDVAAVTSDFYKSLGMPVDDIFSRSDLYDRKGKCPHAFCINIDREGDIRVLENLKNNAYWMDTTLHELGHAVYDKYISRRQNYFLRMPPHAFATEGTAMFFGRIASNSKFVKKYCKEEIDPEMSFKIFRLKQLVFSRWTQVMVRFEQELYGNPDQNLNLLWWKLVKKYQLLDFSRDKPDWASKIHFVSSPVYYHGYLLGEIFASQLNHHISRNILRESSVKNIDYCNRKIGSYFKSKLFSPGASCDWKNTIINATGEGLNPKYYLDDLKGLSV